MIRDKKIEGWVAYNEGEYDIGNMSFESSFNKLIELTEKLTREEIFRNSKKHEEGLIDMTTTLRTEEILNLIDGKKGEFSFIQKIGSVNELDYETAKTVIE